MWHVRNPEIKPATLDFSSSGQGELRVSQLFSDGVRLINALELVDWDAEDSQFLVCEACGYTHCKPGGWVSVRRSGSLILILPASGYVRGAGREREEYGPPPYLKGRGAAYLDLPAYESLSSRHSSFPPAEQVRPLSTREAALLFQWEAPARILGEPPEVRVRRDLIVGSSEGDYAEQLERLETLLRRQYEDGSPAGLRAVSGGERVISFYLDAGEFREWKALVRGGSAYRLLVDSRYVIADEAHAAAGDV